MDKKKIINIINFVRGEDPRNTQEELYDTYKKQVELCRSYPMPYTFLFQYDAMVKPEYAALVKDDADPNCELGVWIELAQEQVEKCGIKWRGRPGFKWDWHVNPGFLMAYPLDQRKALIDELFNRFREIFGYYPKSVGSWLLDTYSIEYMTETYGVDAFCICKDQHGTDGYTLWGGYYNQAYYPSKHNMFVPAQTAENQLNAPVFRMLGSDPIYQYDCSADEHYNPALLQHVYSLEPVWKTGKSEEWVDWYLRNNFDEECITWAYTQAGQENPFRWSNFGEALTMQMKKFWQGVQDGKYEAMTLGDSGRWFKETFKETPASAVTCLDDWNGEGKQAFWYDCKNYRTSFYTAEGRVCIRDMFLFDERYHERYWDTVATGTSATYDALPMVDGYRWSGNDIFCAINFVTAEGEAPLNGCIKEVRSDSETTLSATLDVDGTDVLVLCDEDKITLSNVGNIHLLWRWNTTEETSVAVEGNAIVYTHQGFSYKLNVLGATLNTVENGVRFIPDGDTVSLIPTRV